MSLPAASHASDRNQEATLWVGNIDPALVTEELLYELFVNAGPVVSVHIPRDKVSGTRHPFGFVEFATPRDADYALKVMAAVKLFAKPLRLSRASKDKLLDQQYHAKLFVGNLEPAVDEKLLYETFHQFGPVLSAKIMTEAESDVSRGFGFVVFDSFEAADTALAAMHGQYIANRPIHVSYAFKQGAKGERHGNEAERELERKDRERRGLSTAPLVAPTLSMTGLAPMIPPPPSLPPGFGDMSAGIPPPPPLPFGFPAVPAMPMPPGFSFPPPPPLPSGFPAPLPLPPSMPPGFLSLPAPLPQTSVAR